MLSAEKAQASRIRFFLSSESLRSLLRPWAWWGQILVQGLGCRVAQTSIHLFSSTADSLASTLNVDSGVDVLLSCMAPPATVRTVFSTISSGSQSARFSSLVSLVQAQPVTPWAFSVVSLSGPPTSSLGSFELTHIINKVEFKTKGNKLNTNTHTHTYTPRTPSFPRTISSLCSCPAQKPFVAAYSIQDGIQTPQQTLWAFPNQGTAYHLALSPTLPC